MKLKHLHTTRGYYFSIKIENDTYCFLVETLNLHCRKDCKTIVTIKRNRVQQDCSKRLTKKLKKHIYSIINNLFESK